MEEDGLFIPPCCVSTKLPKAVMQAPRRALTFYTHGDVTFEKFYASISYLVEDSHILVLSMPTLTFATVSYLALCFQRGWITDLILSTSKDVSALIEQYLSPYKSHVLYVAHNNVTDLSSHMVIYTKKQSLSLAGPMIETRLQGVSLVSYSLLYCPRIDVVTSQPWANSLLNILHPDILRVRHTRPNTQELSTNLTHFLQMHLPPYEDEE